MIIKHITENLDDALNIRDEVFTKEQGIDRKLVFNDFDNYPTTKHYVCYDIDMKPIGSCVVLEKDHCFELKRVAILKDYRRKGYGRLMIERVLDMHNTKPVSLSSQLPSEAFYWNMGFRPVGDHFLEAGIPHISMIYNHK